MAIYYCDMSLATGLNDGSSWANAYRSFTLALSSIPAGSTLCLQGSEDMGSTGNISLTNNGTVDNPIIIVGCKSGTTNAPPLPSDIVTDRNDALMPDAYTSNYGINLQGYVYAWGLKLRPQDWLNDLGAPGNWGWITEQCVIDLYGGQADRYLRIGETTSSQFLRLINSRVRFANSSDAIHLYRGGTLEWFGGELAGAITTLFLGGDIKGAAEIVGVDLAAGMAASGVLANAGSLDAARILIDRCKIPSGFTLGTSTGLINWNSCLHNELSNSAAAVASSIQDIGAAYRMGTITEETVVVRTGGANDGDSGAHALAMSLNPSATTESYLPLRSPPLRGWITGDGVTPRTITIYICNSAAENAANLLQDDEAWLDIYYPSGNGDARAEHVSTKPTPFSTPGDLPADTSTWGAGGNNKQKLVVNLDGAASPIPDYNGPVTVVVNYAKRAATPPTLYIDPKVYIA